MYELFTDRARKVMQLANQQAYRFNHEYIGTEHMLLGVVKEGSGVAANVLKNLNVDLRKIRLEVEKLVLSAPEMITMGKLPQTSDVKKSVEVAMEESRNLNHNYVGTEHILLGLLRVGGTARHVLNNLGVSTERARVLTLELLGRGLRDQIDGHGVPIELGEKVPWYDRRAAHLRAGKSIVEQAKSGWLAPSCGPWQLQCLVTALNRSWRNSVLLVGEPGVGKRALVEKLAIEMASGNHSAMLGACGRGIVEITPYDDNPAKKIENDKLKSLLFFENINRFVDSAGAFPAWFHQALTRGVRCIATVSPSNEERFTAQQELAALFEPIGIFAAKREQVVQIVKTRLDAYADNYQVRPTDEAVQEAYELSEQYGHVLYPHHAQPALTLDVIENAAAFEGWKKSRTNEATESTKGGVADLHAHDIAHSVAMRLGREIDDIKNRKPSS